MKNHVQVDRSCPTAEPDPLAYQRAFHRIRAEYAEMPGMRLTVAQVHRLSGVDVAICNAVLEDLVRANFLTVSGHTYARVTGFDGRHHQSETVRPPALALLP